ncbi:aldehyde dehydrogenase [Gloeophyllum trabeum ATCC 11539]|uniref:Aldehyde dehydrogenase n=1 Tax=Gloeophyllum trabeum (strain ATCC 11539 / FP-39264 / Madison 617) TaxID=670483 RepID=S7S1N6_GLOTA|nr:aldehyde dehydrogenase [Gloeophyllum trabeum ATCC 11539]EPQ61365.1 aldehyde dehydrogenase [Gloeophyllum trabeum ATCC 11539]|eukprot:PLAT7038.2.p1 GENE.PLAT7038.2~~PLAT7038.2.p1  ORF type:complete len:501 (+),score=45.74 PLAT7038.2:58-1560(+)
MPSTFTHEFNTPVYKGKSSFNTGLFIDGKFVDGQDGETIDVINPTNGKVITKVSAGTAKDVDIAVAAAQKAFDTVWGLNCAGAVRGKLLGKLADLMEEHADELAALEALDNGKTFGWAKNSDVVASVGCIRYYSGWADKHSGKVIETDENKLAYTRNEPIGVVGQIIPWNFPLMMLSWKLGPALATGCTIVLKPSEFTPLTALRMCELIQKAGFPPGVVNIVNGLGTTVGQAIAEHPKIEKVAFTGSTLVGRKIMEAAAKTNLKKVTLELGGKSPNIIFNDADLEQAVNWAVHGIFWNHGQACCAGSRIFVQEGIYQEFLTRFTEKAKSLKIGDPFEPDAYQGPQVSQTQYDRIMGYINSGKEQGAKLHLGGERHGNEGYFIKPTIFTDTKPNMKIVQEEIFGPVGVVIKFTDEDDIIRQANDTVYGLAAAVFTQNINQAIETAHRLHAGTVWINCANQLHPQIPFGGFKQSGIGRELGEYALANYSNVKAVHVNLGHKM